MGEGSSHQRCFKLPELGEKYKYKDVDGYCRAITAPESDNPVYFIVGKDKWINVSKSTLELHKKGDPL